MEGILDILVSAAFWAAAIRIATPLLLGTLGELICERAGVLNLGIEGIMTAGAMTGWMAVYQGADLWTGVAVAAGVGMAFGLIHALLTVPLGLSQHVTGIGITLLATSLSYFTYRIVLPDVTKTRAPSAAAICTTKVATPLPIPGTTTVSPACNPPRVTTAR